ncbi:MAG: hypothetical protein IJ455_06705 [Agathobacter sp.]|nr:hypothetical protein [Agathobacter sp.]
MITNDNFKEKWDFVNHKLDLIAKRKVIRKAVSFVGNIVFLLYYSLIAFGLLHELKDDKFLAYLDKAPVFADVWNAVEPVLHHPKMHWAVQALIYILPVYVLVAIASGIVFALLWFLYQPKSKYSMTENIAEDSATLYKMARIAKIRAANPIPATSFACNVIFIFGIMVYLTGFIMELIAVNDMEKLMELMMLYYSNTISPYFSNSLFVLLVPLIFLGTYTILNSLMGYMLMPLYMTKVPEELEAETEQFYHECNPEVKERFEAEEKVLAQAKEINERRREEKKAFQDELHWKNPIWKKVKIGCTIAVVIAMMALIGWVGSKVDMKGVWDTLNSYRENGEVLDTETSTEDFIEGSTEVMK